MKVKNNLSLLIRELHDLYLLKEIQNSIKPKAEIRSKMNLILHNRATAEEIKELINKVNDWLITKRQTQSTQEVSGVNQNQD